MVTTLSSREFNHDVSAAKRAANEGPVVIMDRGRASHVLMNYDEWVRIVGRQQTIGDLLHAPGVAEVELSLPDRDTQARGAEFS